MKEFSGGRGKIVTFTDMADVTGFLCRVLRIMVFHGFS